MRAIHKIAVNFNKDSDVCKDILSASEEMKKLTALKEKCSKKFELRKNKKKEDLPKFDKELFEDMLDDAKKMDNK